MLTRGMQKSAAEAVAPLMTCGEREVPLAFQPNGGGGQCDAPSSARRKRAADMSPKIEKVVAPREYLNMLVRESADPPYAPAIELFDAPIAAERIAGYTAKVLEAIRDGAWTTEMSCCDASNRFGVTILHKACRAQSLASVERLLAAGAPLSSCDSGRVPLHDAVWTTNPNFDLVSLLVAEDASQLFRLDTRGFSCLDYAPQETWPRWCAYLDGIKREVRACLRQSESPFLSVASPLVAFEHEVSPARKRSVRLDQLPPPSVSPPPHSDAAASPASALSGKPPSPPPEVELDAGAVARLMGACAPANKNAAANSSAPGQAPFDGAGAETRAALGKALQPTLNSGDTPPDEVRRLDSSGTWWNLFPRHLRQKLPRTSEDGERAPSRGGSQSPPFGPLNDENSPKGSPASKSGSPVGSPPFSISPATLTRLAASSAPNHHEAAAN